LTLSIAACKSEQRLRDPFSSHAGVSTVRAWGSPYLFDWQYALQPVAPTAAHRFLVPRGGSPLSCEPYLFLFLLFALTFRADLT
jgi:hypothetical protein